MTFVSQAYAVAGGAASRRQVWVTEFGMDGNYGGGGYPYYDPDVVSLFSVCRSLSLEELLTDTEFPCLDPLPQERHDLDGRPALDWALRLVRRLRRVVVEFGGHGVE